MYTALKWVPTADHSTVRDRFVIKDHTHMDTHAVCDLRFTSRLGLRGRHGHMARRPGTALSCTLKGGKRAEESVRTCDFLLVLIMKAKFKVICSDS